MKDLYEELGVPRDSIADDIKKAYRKKAAQAHPDKGGDREEFHAITVAKDILTDSKRRAHYDKHGEDTPLQDAHGILLGEVARLIQAVMEQTTDDVEHTDIIEVAQQFVRNGIAQQRQKLREKELRISKLERTRARLSKKKNPGDTALMDILSGMTKAMGLENDKTRDSIDRAERAAEFLAEYSYRVDAAPTFNGFILSPFGR